MPFWINNPVEINNSNKLTKILSNEQLLNKTNRQIINSNVKLDYTIHDKMEDRFIEFINNNYINCEENILRLVYNKELLELYDNSMIIEFKPKNKNTIVGFIIGRKISIYIDDIIEESLEVNFLCIIPKLRNLNLAPYMINILTKCALIKYNISIANYTIHDNIKAPYFSKKKFYHIPLNITKLIQCKFFYDGFFKDEFTVDKFKNIYNEFNYIRNTFKIHYFCNTFIEESKIILLYNRLIKYYKKTFTIYEYLSIEKFKLLISNKSFHHFIIYNNDNEIISYLCLFNLVSLNTKNDISYNNGNIFLMFFDKMEDIKNIFEIVKEYIFTNNIFDIISFTDILKVKLECISGSCELKYYLFNTKYSLIENSKNGLITI